MGFVVDALTGKKMLLVGDVLDQSGTIPPGSLDLTPNLISEALYQRVDVSTDQIITGTEDGNFYNFTTGSSDLTCQVANILYDADQVNDTIFRIRKADSGVGTVTVNDYQGNELVTLYNQGNWVDVIFDGTNYILM